MSKTNLKSLFFLAFFSLLFACADQEEGCLDIEATNYDVTADTPCDNCCSYPTLSLNFTYVWDSFSFRNTAYYSSEDQPLIQILDAQVLLSNIELRLAGQSIRIQDSITLPLLVNGQDLEQSFVDDFIRVSRQINFNYPIGSIRSLQSTVDSLYFQIGLDPVLADVDTSATPAGHPLTNAISSLYDAPGTGFQSIRFQLKTDSISPMPDTLFYRTGLGAVRLVKLPVNQQIERGFDLNLSLQVDYQKWLEGINFATDPTTSIEEKLLENAAAAFSILE